MPDRLSTELLISPPSTRTEAIIPSVKRKVDRVLIQHTDFNNAQGVIEREFAAARNPVAGTHQATFFAAALAYAHATQSGLGETSMVSRELEDGSRFPRRAGRDRKK